jgi:ParB family transcriptional regulator, chromosome partitioning protein
MMQAQKRRLGRGLAALIGDDVVETLPAEELNGLRQVPIELLHPNPNNPRKQFKEEELSDLAQSIGDKGLLQPLVVRQRSDGEYEIVAGERRWRASQRAGLHHLPVLVRELSDGETLEIALIENIQRTDLNPLEEARAYQQLLQQFSYTQQQLADSVRKSRSHIANTLRLLNLPDSVRGFIEDGKLTAGHARTLVATDSPAELANKIISLGLSVREAENLSRENSAAPASRAKLEKNADTRALEKQISDALGLRTEIKAQGREGGTLMVKYKTLDQLDALTSRLTMPARFSQFADD